MVLKFCSFNVNSIKVRVGLVLEWLKKREFDIDILCLQELKTPEDKFPFDEFESAGYSSYVFGQKTYNGVAICSKRPLKNIQKGIDNIRFDEQSRIISASLGDIRIINIYAPHGDIRGEEKYNYKMWWYKTFIEYIRLVFSSYDKIIITGDLNITTNDMDVYDSVLLNDTIGTMPEERELLNELKEISLIDTMRYLYPHKKQFSWWSYTGGAVWKDEGMRIDYVMCSKKLLNALKDSETDLWPRKRRTPKPSDHAPVIATFMEEQPKS